MFGAEPPKAANFRALSRATCEAVTMGFLLIHSLMTEVAYGS
jgi:hypothetical protein